MRARFVEEGHQGDDQEGTIKSKFAAKALRTTHKLVQYHPYTKRPFLYANEAHLTKIIGLPDDESAALVKELCEHVTKPEYLYKHVWQVGDVLMWDNLLVVHKADFDYKPDQKRNMLRVTLRGPKIP